MTEEKISELCKALGDPNRLKIIKLLNDGEQCACKLLEAFQITQPTLSHHMKILSETGLVSSRKEGKWTYYSISCCMFKEFKSYFDSITCYKDRHDHSECCCGGK
ncbi:MAG: winged helix-turn-helix transcriptional regulator [Treponema sp.]|uniref:ArsR/SmtB family transcription factor n=1 Tax=Treponema sp. TaxID=166 RepID=UPI001D58640C|nr:metalloregulator ArsR/SmtB family transcription factor [Treponema sp.]MBS7311614.1 winged helix-turn-helix transcriptional regulator [Treponema sp.]